MLLRNKFIIFICIFTSFSVFFMFSASAVRFEEINTSDYPIYLTLDYYDEDSLVFSSDSLTGLSLYPTSIRIDSNNSNIHANTYYSTKLPGSDGTSVSFDRGTAMLTKLWGWDYLDSDEDTEAAAASKAFLEKNVLITKISFWVVFGFSSSPTSNPLQSFTFLRPLSDNGVDIYFDGRQLDRSLFDSALTTISEIPNYSRRQDTNSGRYFSYRAARYDVVFNEPLTYTSTDPSDYGVTSYVSFSSPVGSDGFQNLYALVGFDSIDVEYVYPSEYESGIITTNKQNIYDNKVKLDSINDSLDVSKPDQNVVDNLMNDINVSDVDYIVGLSKFDDSFPAFNSLVTTVLLGTLSIAFIGYALHGKR